MQRVERIVSSLGVAAFLLPYSCSVVATARFLRDVSPSFIMCVVVGAYGQLLGTVIPAVVLVVERATPVRLGEQHISIIADTP